MRRELVSLHWFPSPFLPTLSDPPSERQDRLQRMERNSPFFPIFISSPFHVSLLYPPPVFPLFRGQTHIYKKPLLCCCSSDLPANHHPMLSRIVTFYTTNEFSFFFFFTTVSGPGVKCSCLCPAWPVPKRNKPICVHTTSPDTTCPTVPYLAQSAKAKLVMSLWT